MVQITSRYRKIYFETEFYLNHFKGLVCSVSLEKDYQKPIQRNTSLEIKLC